jgi:ABC-type bacteriocin/lantibiotic exporter with double-glycine peptidase domain
VIQRFSIPWIAWQGFQLAAARKGFNAKEYLAALIVATMEQGRTIQEAIEFLFALHEWREEVEQALEASLQ